MSTNKPSISPMILELVPVLSDMSVPSYMYLIQNDSGKISQVSVP